MSAAVSVRPASTVALLRDGSGGLETLLVRRNRQLAFAGGFWVFPGGAIDEGDRERAGDEPEMAARLAAAREAQEEAGVSADPEGMVLVSHWTTPVGEKRRFSTWIYAAAVDRDTTVTIDGSEIHDHQWVGVRAALQAHRARELPMLPPTYITLKALERYRCAADAIAGERETPCPEVLPLMLPTEEEGGFLTVYPGDVAYDGGDIDASGPRHRTVLVDGCWHYEFSGVSAFPPLYPRDGVTH